jgi:predicted small lipoprotein YifL
MANKTLQCTVVAALLITGCGQKGPLYLPDAASEVVTRPTATPPPEDSPAAPNSPQTTDSTPQAPSPAPEVTAPEAAPDPDDPKKEKGATPPPK